MMFEATWQRLTLSQRGVLRAVVLEEGTRAAVGGRRVNAIGSAAPRACSTRSARSCATMSSAATAGRYVVVDSLMREWVARRTF